MLFPDNNTLIVVCQSESALARVAAEHGLDQVAVLSSRQHDGYRRVWWPLLEECWDRRVADAAAERLTRQLPCHLRAVTPEATTLLAGALHAASLVGWPTVTLTHILDSGAVPTIVELLGCQDEELAADVAAAAGEMAPEAALVRTAAAYAAQQLHHGELMLTGPGAARPGDVLAGPQRPVVVVFDDHSPVATLILSRLTFVAHAGGPVVMGGIAA